MEKTDSLPESDKPTVRLAPSHYRLLAAAIDCLAALLLTRLLIMPLLIPYEWDTQIEGAFSQNSLLIYLLGFLIVFLKDCFGGKSLGKMIFNLKVCLIEKDYPKVPYKKLFLRNLFLILLPLELILLISDKCYRRWGDKFCGTMVLQELKPFKVRSITVRVVAVLFGFAFFWSLNQVTAPLMIRKTGVYAYAANYALNDLSLREALGTADFTLDFWFDYANNAPLHTFSFTVSGKEQTVIYSISVLHQNGGYSFYDRKIQRQDSDSDDKAGFSLFLNPSVAADSYRMSKR